MQEKHNMGTEGIEEAVVDIDMGALRGVDK